MVVYLTERIEAAKTLREQAMDETLPINTRIVKVARLVELSHTDVSDKGRGTHEVLEHVPSEVSLIVGSTLNELYWVGQPDMRLAVIEFMESFGKMKLSLFFFTIVAAMQDPDARVRKSARKMMDILSNGARGGSVTESAVQQMAMDLLNQ